MSAFDEISNSRAWRQAMLYYHPELKKGYELMDKFYGTLFQGLMKAKDKEIKKLFGGVNGSKK